jgi:UDP-N-acetylglucosamine--N-acetylmuramyl-(pentapeptide) pyrophosphoryl-undecaprenol N-acetylglucosamine transferase
MFFTGLFARLRGARVIVIDSFARFDKPSAFARIAGPIADWRIAQSPACAKAWNGAECHDPLVMLEGERPAKEPLLFATVGATLPYERLLDYVGDAKKRGLIPERVVVQTGAGAAPIDGVECVETLDFDAMRAVLAKADLVVCHGGTGSIVTALQAGCRTIAIPRLFERGEHYDNHQLEITEAFEKRGLLFVARTREEFAAALVKARVAAPRLATTDPQGLIARLTEIVDGLASAGAQPVGAVPMDQR